MELAKLTSKGQITIPIEIRKKLKLKEGDKVFFLEEKGKIYFENASQAALRDFQGEMTGQAAKAGFQSEDDVVEYIKSIRGSSEKRT
jgi:AbrB family looped-hinge helix DNA binding protein